MFLVIEGLDGGGKSTQATRLAQWLRQQGKSVVECRDPGTTAAGGEIRRLILHRAEIALDPHCEALLFMAARSQLVAEVIAPALRRGEWVVCDRFQLSTIVYQGHAGMLDVEQVRRVSEFAGQGCAADHTLLLDLPVDVAVGRLRGQPDRLEARGGDYFQKVRQGFLSEAARLGPRASVLDATADIEGLAGAIRRIVQPYLDAGGCGAAGGGGRHAAG